MFNDGLIKNITTIISEKLKKLSTDDYARIKYLESLDIKISDLCGLCICIYKDNINDTKIGVFFQTFVYPDNYIFEIFNGGNNWSVKNGKGRICSETSQN